MRAAPTAVSDPHVRASRPYRTVVRLWTVAGATVSTVHVQTAGVGSEAPWATATT